MTGRRDHARTMRVFFETYGTGPWICEECEGPIASIGRHRYNGNVHHRDEDKSNDTPENLCVLHVVCHLRLHPPSDAARAAISATLKGRPSPTRGMTFGAETNARKARHGHANGFYGRRHSEETKEKMRQPRRRVICDRCGREFAVNWIRRHRCQT